jgi:ABC-type transport system involved in cytochrome c biogenesis permease component
MNALIPVLCAIAGALVYALASHPKLGELARLLFMAAIFAVMFAFAGRSIHLF